MQNLAAFARESARPKRFKLHPNTLNHILNSFKRRFLNLVIYNNYGNISFRIEGSIAVVQLETMQSMSRCV